MIFYSQEINNIGKIITIGSLHLSLTLRLEKIEIQNLGINYRRIKYLSDLSFLLENESLWERIELSSNNELLNILFHMNRIKKIKNIVTYLVYDKLKLNEEQIKFQRLLDIILLSNGVMIYSYNIFKCKMSICFKIMYKNYIKKVMLLGEDEYDEEELNLLNKSVTDNSNDSILNNIFDNSTSKNNNSSIDEYVNNINENENSINNNNIKLKKENTKEEIISIHKEESEESRDNDDNIGFFQKLPEDEINFANFKFFYFHLNDYINGGEFQEMFRLQEIYNFMKKLKNNTKIKIIFNFGENLKYIRKYLIKFLKISDIHIFRKKTELDDILIKKYEEENKKVQKNNIKIFELFKERNTHLFKKIKFGKHKKQNQNSPNPSIIRSNKISKISKQNSAIGYYGKMEYKNQRKKNIISSRLLNLTYDKHKKCLSDKSNTFNYLYELFYSSNNKHHFPYINDKLGIYLDDFKKVYIVEYKPTNLKPILTEYDLNIYPKTNVHNLKEIERIKEIFYTKYITFNNIIYGCILRTILDDIAKGRDNYYLFYYYIHVSVIKYLSLIKNGLNIPLNKSFYLVAIKKNELLKIRKAENIKKKEKGFNMNYLHINYKEKENSLMTPIDNKLQTLDWSKSKNSFNENNKYRTIYNDINNMTNNQRFPKFNNQKKSIKNHLNEKRGFKYSFSLMEKMPQFACYLNKNERKKLLIKKLPPIGVKKKNKLFEDLINAKIEKEKETEGENVDISKYQEIKF